MTEPSTLPLRARRAAGAAYRRIAPVFENSRRSKWLPMDSRTMGPPRRWARTPEYCEERGFEWREVVAAGDIVRRPPHCVNYPAADVLKLVTEDMTVAGIARLANARVVAPHGWIIADGDTYLPDHSWYRNAIDECPIYKKDGLKETAHLRGVTLSLCTDWSTNYAHTLFDALSRIHLFEQAGYTWDDVSHVLMPELSSDGKLTAAQLCGIPMDKVVTLSNFSVVECEELVAPTFPGIRRNTPRWVAEFWRSKSPRIEQQGRRYFISRRGSSRTVSNEDQLAPVLAKFGFETIVSSEKTIRDRFPEAEIIIGPHGAALADILFCNPGSVLIELTPPGHVFPYYYTLADSVGMEYFSILGKYPKGRTGRTMSANFEISPEELRATIDAAESVLHGEKAVRRDQPAVASIA